MVPYQDHTARHPEGTAELGEGCVAVLQAIGLGVEIDKAGLTTIMQRPWSERRG